jgi:hypothetical protein
VAVAEEGASVVEEDAAAPAEGVLPGRVPETGLLSAVSALCGGVVPVTEEALEETPFSGRAVSLLSLTINVVPEEENEPP